MAKRRKKKRIPFFKWLFLIVLICVFTYTMLEIRNANTTVEADNNLGSQVYNEGLSSIGSYPTVTSDTFSFTDEAGCDYGILIDLKTNNVICSRKPDEKIYPASLTKVMTLLVAVENIKDLNATYTMSFDILDSLYLSDASMAGFSEGEQCKMIDLLYGAILPSGADATTALSNYIAGNETAFVELMNKKVSELGLRNTHFTNASGLHNKEHYSTVTDIALILEAALKNDLCRQVLSTYVYTTSVTEHHPEGIQLISTLLSRMYGDEVAGMTIEGGKTGYTLESGHSIASFAKVNSTGDEYVLVLASGDDIWEPVFDCFTVYGYILNNNNPSNLSSDNEASGDTVTSSAATASRMTEAHISYYDYIKQKKEAKAAGNSQTSGE